MIPYAPTSQYRPNNRLTDLLLRAAEDQAEGHRRSGQIWGGAVAGLGNIAANAVEQHQEQKAMSRRDEAVAQLWESSQGNPDPKDLVRIYGPKEGMALATNLAQFNAAKANPRQDALKQFPAVAGIMSKLGPQLQEAFWNNEVIPVGQAAGIVSEPVPWKPGIEKELLGGFMPQEAAPDTAVVEGNLVDKRTGKPIFTAPPKPETAPNLQHVETAEGIRTFNPKTGEMGPVIAKGKPSAPKDPSFQAKDILGDDGKPMVANFDSRSGKYYGPGNVEIKNPQPIPSDRVSQDQQKFKKAEPVIKGISELSERINTGSGLLAKMSGGAAKVAAKANYDDDVAEYESLISGFTPMVARAVGHTGVLTEMDVQSVRKLFPNPGDSKTLRDRKIKRLLNIMSDLEGVGAGGADLQKKAAPDGSKPGPGVSQGIITTPDGKKWKNIGGRMVEQK